MRRVTVGEFTSLVPTGTQIETFQRHPIAHRRHRAWRWHPRDRRGNLLFHGLSHSEFRPSSEARR